MEERQWKCTTCPKIFKQKQLLTVHIETIHGQAENYPCDICDKVFANEKYCKLHRKRHGNPSLKCDKCDLLFQSKYILKKHMIVHSDERPFKCAVCEKTFKHRHVFDYHVKTQHCKEENAGKCTCDICGKSYATKKSAAAHRKRHGKTTKTEVYCEHCGKCFRDNYSLKKHINSNHYGKRHICNICGISIGDRGNLNKHMKLHDPIYQKPAPEVCQICKKTFPNVKRHFKAVHEKDGKNYKCEVCDKFFRGKEGLKFHMMVHRGDKPFKCDFCDKSFILNTLLQQHLRTHPESDVKPFECLTCHKTFVKPSLLEYHMNTHLGRRPFKCEFCDKTFSSRKYCRAHERNRHLK